MCVECIFSPGTFPKLWLTLASWFTWLSALGGSGKPLRVGAVSFSLLQCQCWPKDSSSQSPWRLWEHKNPQARITYLLIQLCVCSCRVSKCWVQTIVSVGSKNIFLEAIKGDIFYSLFPPEKGKINSFSSRAVWQGSSILQPTDFPLHMGDSQCIFSQGSLILQSGGTSE